MFRKFYFLETKFFWKLRYSPTQKSCFRPVCRVVVHEWDLGLLQKLRSWLLGVSWVWSTKVNIIGRPNLTQIWQNEFNTFHFHLYFSEGYKLIKWLWRTSPQSFWVCCSHFEFATFILSMLQPTDRPLLWKWLQKTQNGYGRLKMAATDSNDCGRLESSTGDCRGLDSCRGPGSFTAIWWIYTF